jgi:hypothetical protein
MLFRKVDDWDYYNKEVRKGQLVMETGFNHKFGRCPRYNTSSLSSNCILYLKIRHFSFPKSRNLKGND